MSSKYFIDYEALAYNLPACEGLEFLDHNFVINTITPEIENSIFPNNDPLRANFTFLSCIINDRNGNMVYITTKNKKTIEIETVFNSEEELHEYVTDLIKDRITQMERHLIFTTNLHIFFPIIKINVHSCKDNKNYLYGHIGQHPMPYRKWTWSIEKIDIWQRLNLHLNKDMFDRFYMDKNHERYRRAFDYYIQSFYEFDHSISFCILCTAIDAITGKSNANQTKERLAKYSSVLFCNPLEINDIKEQMKHFYKLRSDFIHGKINQIEVKDEICLREYVRLFLLSYFHFWLEMDIKNEQQMLQKLDDIYNDHSLYIKYAPASYSFISLLREHESQPEGILNMSLQQKAQLVNRIFFQAILPNSESNT